jgi:hypothetical protein
MRAPEVVTVRRAPAREPRSDAVWRVVEVADGSRRLERWDSRCAAWVACTDDAWGVAQGVVLDDAGLRTLGIPPADPPAPPAS